MQLGAATVLAAVIGVAGAAVASVEVADLSTPSRPADSAAWCVAQAQGAEQPELEPRYEPAPLPPPKSSYNSGYLFGMTRGVAQSTLVPGLKVPLFVITVPLDIVFLPFAAIGGFFG
jgi:hypothetical protein